MLSRIRLKQPLRQALNITKFQVENAAFIHISCHNHNLKLASSGCKLLKNYRRPILCTRYQIRFESSSASTVRQTSQEVLDPIPDPPTPLPDAVPDIVQSAASTIENVAGEPSFASLGLGGWTPVGLIQTFMEYLHIDCGLPWWGSVVCGTLILRLFMFPVVILSQRNSAKLNNNLPQLQQLQLKLSDARQRGDKYSAAKYSNELVKFMQEKEVNPFKSILPALCQAPIFISVFMGLRGMTNLPVESLKTGGLFWFVDLTVPDQFFLLPLITSATLFCTVKLGTDGQPMQAQTSLVTKYVFMALPVIVFPFTLKFPGLILVYWTTSNFVSLVQVGVLQIPQVRDFFKIERKVAIQKSELPLKDKGFVKNMKEAWANMKITSEMEARENADKMAFLKAGREPIKKTYKYDPTQVRPQSTMAAKKRT